MLSKKEITDYQKALNELNAKTDEAARHIEPLGTSYNALFENLTYGMQKFGKTQDEVFNNIKNNPSLESGYNKLNENIKKLSENYNAVNDSFTRLKETVAKNEHIFGIGETDYNTIRLYKDQFIEYNDAIEKANENIAKLTEKKERLNKISKTKGLTEIQKQHYNEAQLATSEELSNIKEINRNREKSIEILTNQGTLTSEQANLLKAVSDRKTEEYRISEDIDRLNKQSSELRQNELIVNDKLIEQDKQRDNYGDKRKKQQYGINAALKEQWGILQRVFEISASIGSYSVEWQDKAYQTSRKLGMSAAQMHNYEAQTAKDVGDIGSKYALTAEQVYAFQERVATATGRVTALNREQKMVLGASTKVFGEDVTDEVIGRMDNLGGGILQSGEELSKIQVNSRNYGLDASKYAKDFAENLTLAQQYNFKDGVEGVRKMTEYSELLKTNMRSIMKAADKMSDIQGSIEASAKLQMLGGNFAKGFSDPLRVLYEAQSDPEAFMKRIMNSTQASSTFNSKTGIAQTNYFGRRQLSAVAEATGIDYNELLQQSQSQAKLNYLGSQMRGNLTEQEKLSVAGRAQLSSNGQYTVTMFNGKTKNISDITSSDIKALKDNDIEKKDLNGNVLKITNMLGQSFKDIKESFLVKAESILYPSAIKIVKVLGYLLKAATSFLARDWGKLNFMKPFAAGVGIMAVANPLSAVKTLIGVPRQITNTIINGFKGVGSTVGSIGRSAANGTTAAIGETTPAISNGSNAIKNTSSIWKTGGSAAKIGGAAASIIIGGAEALISQREGEKAREIASNEFKGFTNNSQFGVYGGGRRATEMDNIEKMVKIEREKSSGVGSGIGTAVGGVAGSLVGGPVGTMIGGILGGFIGKGIGSLLSKSTASITFEEQAKQRKNSYFYETAKFGRGELKGHTVVEAAIIKSADILASIYQVIAEKDKDLKRAINKEANKHNKPKFSITDFSTWFGGFSDGGTVPAFSDGGIVEPIKAANGYSPYSGDHIPIRANADEIVLNENEQRVVNTLIHSPYSTPTKINHKEETGNSYGGESPINGNVNINFTGSISLNSNGERYDFKELMKDETFKRQIADIVVDQMSKNHGGKPNKNILSYKQSSHDARTRMYN